MKVMIVFLLLISNGLPAGGQPVIDVENIKRSAQIVKLGGHQLNELKSITQFMSRFNRSLGYDGLNKINPWQSYLKYLTPQKKFHPILRCYDRDLTHYQRLQLTQQDLFAPEGAVSSKNWKKIQEKRQEILAQTLQTSIAYVAENQHNLDRQQKEVEQIAEKIMQTDCLHEDMVHNNQLLVMLLHELVKSRETQLKILDSLSHTLLQGEGGLK